MSALEDVLAAHTETGDWPNVCSCGFSALSGDHVPSVLRAHVAAAVTAWITERLQDADVLEAVCEAIALVTGNVDTGETEAALTAVTDALRGESTSTRIARANEGDRMTTTTRDADRAAQTEEASA